MTQPGFREVQPVSESWWLRLGVYGVAALAWVGFLEQIVLRRPFGQEPGPDWVMWLIWALFGIGLPAFVHAARLVVDVGSDRIIIRYVPLTTREIPLADVRRCEVRAFRPVWEYGGWGVKGWSRKRMSYTVRGNLGVQVELRDGRSVMIGSQDPQKLAEAIDEGRRPTGSRAPGTPE